MDDKRPVWKVELKDGNKETEVKIDAKSQKILRTKTDGDKKDKKLRREGRERGGRPGRASVAQLLCRDL